MRVRFAFLAVVLTSGVAAGPAMAQSNESLPNVAVPPLNVSMPNYHSVAVGEVGSLEAGAYVARVEDGSATWFNPAGLALALKSSISGSAGVFQIASVTPDRLPNAGGSFQHLPAAVGVVVKRLLGRDRLTAGFQITKTGTWSETADAEKIVSAPGSVERGTYSSTSDYGGYLASVALGYASSDKLRFGASLDGQLTESSSGTYLSDQYATGSELRALLIEGRGSASAVHFRMTGGVQYHPTPSIRLAAVIRTPGLRIWTAGSYFQEGVAKTGPTTTTASFFDGSPEVQLNIPLEVNLGAAYVGRRAQVEVDLLTHASGGTYNGFASSNPVTVLQDGGTGGPVTQQDYAFRPAVIDTAGVVNVAVGGSVKINSTGSWKVHAGFGTDRSPVGPADTRFTRIDMRMWTVGLSGNAGFVSGSFGVRYESGLSDEYSLRVLQNGQPLTTAFKVSNLGIVYSFAFKF